mmetsp:Transcript_8052/g.29155  ORF Transcript_8052/g.29155 Transcript_8052/m.29155 type:complete len:260 (-) Transcript_8052:81-860(-)
MVTSERKQKIKSLSRPLRDLVENERRKVEGEDSQRYLEDDSKRAVEDGLLLVRLPVGLGPPHEVGDPPVPRESDVLVPHHGKVARLRGIKTTGHPSHLGVPVLCELLAGGEGPQALLAGDDDAGVRGDALSHTSHEPRVELHVPVAEPPAAHAKGRHLLQQAARAHIIVGYEEGDLHSALDLALGDLLGRPNVQQDPAVRQQRPHLRGVHSLDLSLRDLGLEPLHLVGHLLGRVVGGGPGGHSRRPASGGPGRDEDRSP